MTRLVLIRHGHVEGIDPERFRGRRDVPLSVLGREQAAAAALRVASHWRPTALYCSPLGRCLETARTLGARLGVDPQPLQTLNDLDYGAWTWKTHAEMRAEDGGGYACWRTRPELMRFPGGESLQDLLARTAEVLRVLLERHLLDTVAIVTHDSVLRALLLQVLDQPPSAYWRFAPTPCGISEVHLDRNGTQVLRVNETAHLEAVG
jgi:probable phosphoglycerate mutase